MSFDVSCGLLIRVSHYVLLFNLAKEQTSQDEAELKKKEATVLDLLQASVVQSCFSRNAILQEGIDVHLINYSCDLS